MMTYLKLSTEEVALLLNRILNVSNYTIHELSDRNQCKVEGMRLRLSNHKESDAIKKELFNTQEELRLLKQENESQCIYINELLGKLQELK